MTTHVEHLRATVDAYKAVREDGEIQQVLAAADALAFRVESLLAEIEHIGKDRPE